MSPAAGDGLAQRGAFGTRSVPARRFGPPSGRGASQSARVGEGAAGGAEGERGDRDVQADALRGGEDDRGVAVPGVGVRAVAGAGAEGEGGVAP